MSSPRGFATPSHVFFADDIMIFCRGSKKNLENIMKLFDQYVAVSGQKISLDKSRFFSGSIPARRLLMISSTLGVPIFKGKPKSSHLLPITDKIKDKLGSWKGVLLSIMGRVQLVKFVIQGSLLYCFQVYYWPASLLKKVDSWLRNFIWSGEVSTRKLVTVAWSKMCAPFNEGGLGIRPIKLLNDDAALKLCWNFFSSDSHWAKFLRARFLRNNRPRSSFVKSSIWPSIKKHINTVHDNSF